MVGFIGRKEELKLLNGLLHKRSASLIVVKGRRRIGKSRLLQQFGQSFRHCYVFSGLAPTEDTTAQMEVEAFKEQLVTQCGIDVDSALDTWERLFLRVCETVQSGSVLVVLDEISWMGSKDPLFLSKLKNAWDLHFKKNDQLVLALCGSVSSWIEHNILSGTGFLGRESLTLTLDEMPLHDCVRFWGNKKVSPSEKIKMLAITGGVPRYLEAINPDKTTEQNIHDLCFTSSGILVTEFDKIFSDLFSRRGELYKKIVSCLANGICDQAEIIRRVGLKKGGDISAYLDDLSQAGFISRDYTWIIRDNKPSKLSHYRLRDNYSRFYLKYIEPRKRQINNSGLKGVSLSSLKGWNTIMGLQVENLVLSNRDLIKASLNLENADIVSDNPYFQRATTRQQGCQIDYLIQTKYNTLYICEIKFSMQELRAGIIHEVKEKISRLKVPRGFSFRPVLIHFGSVSDAIYDEQYFSNIIDFNKLLDA